MVFDPQAFARERIKKTEINELVKGKLIGGVCSGFSKDWE